jgi:hypothetical protein
LPPLTQSKLLKQKQVQPILNAQAKDPTKANPMEELSRWMLKKEERRCSP